MKHLHKTVKRILWSYTSLVISLVLYGTPKIRNNEDMGVLVYMLIIYFGVAVIFTTRDYLRARRTGEV